MSTDLPFKPPDPAPIALLSEIYADHGFGSYFDQMREEFF